MIICAMTGKYLIDPDTVYLQGGMDQPKFRVMSTQRLKVHGVRVVGCFKGTDTDVLQDRTSKKIIELAEEGPTGKKILVLNTIKCPEFQSIKEVKFIVDEIRKRNRSAMVHDIRECGDLMVEDDASVAEAIKEVELMIYLIQ